MTNFANRIGIFLVITEAFILLLPSTAIFIIGMVFVLLGVFHGHAGSFDLNLGFLTFALILILPGYGLVALWFLVFKYRKYTSLKQIPVFIRLGIFIGAATAILFLLPFGIKPPTEFVSFPDHLKTIFIFGLGPVVTLVTLGILIYIQGRPNKRMQSDRSKPASRSSSGR